VQDAAFFVIWTACRACESPLLNMLPLELLPVQPCRRLSGMREARIHLVWTSYWKSIEAFRVGPSSVMSGALVDLVAQSWGRSWAILYDVEWYAWPQDDCPWQRRWNAARRSNGAGQMAPVLKWRRCSNGAGAQPRKRGCPCGAEEGRLSWL